MINAAVCDCERSAAFGQPFAEQIAAECDRDRSSAFGKAFAEQIAAEASDQIEEENPQCSTETNSCTQMSGFAYSYDATGVAVTSKQCTAVSSMQNVCRHVETSCKPVMHACMMAQH